MPADLNFRSFRKLWTIMCCQWHLTPLSVASSTAWIAEENCCNSRRNLGSQMTRNCDPPYAWMINGSPHFWCLLSTPTLMSRPC
ncbi:hypothetical protein B0H19DRAFT_1110589 [Mycena capillaripes]|nr:hypothetical protein B0H19DRAFT_1110589 [Mycena capillaripes]